MSKLTSAMGKTIDMAKLRASNEHVRAVGNMSVNARGDIIDNANQVVEPASARVQRVYRKATMNPTAQTATPPPMTKLTPERSMPTVDAAALPPLAPVQPLSDTSQSELAMFEEIDDIEIIKPDQKPKKK